MTRCCTGKGVSISMIAQDYRGKSIPSATYQVLRGYGNILECHGYRESTRTLNLFGRRGECGIIYLADMTGRELGFWHRAVVFSAKRPGDMPDWKYRRLLNREYKRLCVVPCISVSLGQTAIQALAQLYQRHRWRYGDGYCIECGKDFQADGAFCDEDCQHSHIHNEWIESTDLCVVCNTRFEPGILIWHHTNYAKDETIDVCRSCHSKIHSKRHTQLAHLKPVDARPRPPPPPPGPRPPRGRCKGWCRGKGHWYLADDGTFKCSVCRPKPRPHQDGMKLWTPGLWRQ